MAVLREWKVPIALSAPEPNTWREVLQAIDDHKLDLRDKQVAVQEYGVSNPELLEGLRERGAQVTAVPVYRWDLPEDRAPLREAVESIIARPNRRGAFYDRSAGHSLVPKLRNKPGRKDGLQASLENVVKASIGPTTSEVLRSYELSIDLEASHPKMGFLVKEAAEQSEDLVRRNRLRAG